MVAWSQLLDNGTIRSHKAANPVRQAVARVAGALVAIPMGVLGGMFLGVDMGVAAGMGDGSALQALATMFNATRGVYV